MKPRMTRLRLLSLIAIFVFFVASGTWCLAKLPQDPFISQIKQVKQGVFRVIFLYLDEAGRHLGRSNPQGTAFLIDDGNYVVTASHVVKKFDEAKQKGKEKYPSKTGHVLMAVEVPVVIWKSKKIDFNKDSA